jgi:hypothetical protein
MINAISELSNYVLVLKSGKIYSLLPSTGASPYSVSPINAQSGGYANRSVK